MPRNLREMRFREFLEHIVARSRLNVGLEHTTRVARIEKGSETGQEIGLLPLATQMLEWPEECDLTHAISGSFLGGKNGFLVPVQFILKWFVSSRGRYFSVITGEELGGNLDVGLQNPENVLDIIPYMNSIFGEQISFVALRRVPEFISDLLAVRVDDYVPNLQVWVY